MKRLLLPLLATQVLTTACIPDNSSPEARHIAIKTVLRNGIKECIVREIENETTKFSDAPSFLGKYSKFKIESLNPNSCYEAKAVYETNLETWYQIVYDPETEEVLKTCGDSTMIGCEEGNTWE